MVKIERKYYPWIIAAIIGVLILFIFLLISTILYITGPTIPPGYKSVGHAGINKGSIDRTKYNYKVVERTDKEKEYRYLAIKRRFAKKDIFIVLEGSGKLQNGEIRQGHDPVTEESFEFKIKID